MNIRSTSVAVLAAVPLALAGCSQGEPQQPAPPQQEQQEQPQQQEQGKPAQASSDGVAWAGQLCGLVGGFSAAQQQSCLLYTSDAADE